MSAPRAVAGKAAAGKTAAKPSGKRGVPRKEAVRTPPASPSPSPATSTLEADGEASAAALKLAADIDRALGRGQSDLLSDDALQALMAVVCRSYSAQVEAGRSFPPLAERSLVTSTDVMVTASGLLKSANLAVFELGMWQSWTGR
jgi:hypothetical protein